MFLAVPFLASHRFLRTAKLHQHQTSPSGIQLMLSGLVGQHFYTTDWQPWSFFVAFPFQDRTAPLVCWMFLLGSVGGNLSLLDQPTVASDRCLRLDCNSRDSAWPFSRMHRTKIVLHLCKIAESCRHGRPVLSYLVTSWLVVSHNMIWHDHTYSCEELVTWPD